MKSKRNSIIFWSIFLIINLYYVVTDIIDGSILMAILNFVGASLAAWLAWDAYQEYKAEKWAVKTMHNVFITINNAETDAKEAAKKIAEELSHTLKNK